MSNKITNTKQKYNFRHEAGYQLSMLYIYKHIIQKTRDIFRRN